MVELFLTPSRKKREILHQKVWKRFNELKSKYPNEKISCIIYSIAKETEYTPTRVSQILRKEFNQKW